MLESRRTYRTKKQTIEPILLFTCSTTYWVHYLRKANSSQPAIGCVVDSYDKEKQWALCLLQYKVRCTEIERFTEVKELGMKLLRKYWSRELRFVRLLGCGNMLSLKWSKRLKVSL